MPLRRLDEIALLTLSAAYKRFPLRTLNSTVEARERGSTMRAFNEVNEGVLAFTAAAQPTPSSWHNGLEL